MNAQERKDRVKTKAELAWDLSDAVSDLLDSPINTGSWEIAVNQLIEAQVAWLKNPLKRPYLGPERTRRIDGREYMDGGFR